MRVVKKSFIFQITQSCSYAVRIRIHLFFYRKSIKKDLRYSEKLLPHPTYASMQVLVKLPIQPLPSCNSVTAVIFVLILTFTSIQALENENTVQEVGLEFGPG